MESTSSQYIAPYQPICYIVFASLPAKPTLEVLDAKCHILVKISSNQCIYLAITQSS